MQQRIRSVAIIVNDKNQILLCRNRSAHTGQDYYVPPGGGLDDGENVLINAVREAKEETGLEIEIDKLVYYAEFLSSHFKCHNLELYFLAKSFKGQIKWDHPDADDVIEEVVWLGQSDLTGKRVFPDILKDKFWEDLKNGFPEVRYLGQTSL